MGVQINGSEGNVIATKGTYSGNVTIGGTLTYEDVTNIDSVGLVTARTGIEIGARPGVAASISVDGNAIFSGIVTAAQLGGDVSIEDKIVHVGDTNTAIRFPSADTFTVETGGSERVRIASDGNVGINSSSPASKLDVVNSFVSKSWSQPASVVTKFERNGHCRVSLVASNASQSQIDFADNDDDNAGYIRYDHSDSSMSFRTAGSSERLRITSDGQFVVGHTAAHAIDLNHQFRVQVSGTNFPTSGISQQRFEDAGSGATLALCHSRSGTQGGHTILQSNDEYGKIRFYGSDGTDFDGYGVGIVGKVDGGIGVNSTPGRFEVHTTPAGGVDGIERFRIDSTGRVTSPYQVAFSVTGSADNLDLDPGDKVAFNNISGGGGAINTNRTTYNSVTVFNTTSYEFTAPVAGLYLFTLSFYMRGVNGSVTTQFVLAKNGTEISHSNHLLIISVFAAEGLQPNGSQILDLAAGDVITVHRRTAGQSGTSRVYMPHSYFMGTLLG